MRSEKMGISYEREWAELRHLMPGGVSSPVRSGDSVGTILPIIAKGDGAWIEDTHHNRYLDCCLSWGALPHGHAHPKIVEAACQAVRNGSTFGTATLYEKSLAEAIKQAFPSIDMVRFVSTGTESTMSAVRLARAYTKKNVIIKFEGHYHGHADQFLVHAGSGVSALPQSSSLGIPPEFVANTLSIPFNDEQAIENAFRNGLVAAVILEPVPANMGVVPAFDGFLQKIRELTLQNGALLIFDEVITGFRVARGGAQELYGIQADLTCLGKIIGGGMPAAAFGGKKEIMELLSPLGGVYQAGTLSGNPVAMCAGAASLQLLSEKTFYEKMARKTVRLLHPIIECLKTHEIPACVQSVGSMWTIFFGTKKVHSFSDLSCLNQAAFRRFFRYMLHHGIFIPPAQNEASFLSGAHTEEEIDYIRETVIRFLEKDYCQ